METDLDLKAVCRDEWCACEDVHLKDSGKCQPVRRKWRAPKREMNPHVKHDRIALAESIIRSIEATDWPLAFQNVRDDVLHDYGATTDRSIHRYLQKFVEAGKVVRLELGLAFAVYIRPASRFLGDPSNLRDNLLGRYEQWHRKRARISP